MEYFKLSKSASIETIGRFPQCGYMEGHSPRLLIQKEIKPFRFGRDIPPIWLKLHKGAKITSFLSSNLPFGLLVDQKVKNVLDEYSLPPHRFYSVKVFKGKVVYSYYWFHYIIDNFLEVVDMKKTVLKVHHITGLNKITQLLSVEDVESILNLKKNLSYEYKLKFHEIHFTEKILKYDLYGMQFVEYFPFINEKLKARFEQESITGYEVQQLTKIH